MAIAVVIAVVLGVMLLSRGGGIGVSIAQPPILPPPVGPGGIQGNVANVNANGEMAVTSAAISGVEQTLSGNPIQGAVSFLSSLWQGHVQRLQDATSENQAADRGVPGWDSDYQQIIAYWNSGQADAAMALSYLSQLKNQIYNYMHNAGASGRPGTAWTDYAGPESAPPQPCNKACTVSCCIYHVYMLGPMNVAAAVISGTKITQGWGVAGYRNLQFNGGYAFLQLGTIQPSSYSSFTRPGYVVKIRMPS